MHPLLKRILIHGVLTAVLLAGIGVVFMQLAGVMTVGATARPGSEHLNPPLSESLRYRVPLMMAFWGFVFVVVCESLLWRVRSRRAAVAATAPAAPQPDETEKLLNELLAREDAKRQEEGHGEQKAEEQKA